MHPSRRVVERKTAPHGVARIVRAAPTGDQENVPLIYLPDPSPPAKRLASQQGKPPEDIDDVVLAPMPSRADAEMIIAGHGEQITCRYDAFYTPLRLANLYPDIVQGSIAHLPLWAISAIRRTSSPQASSRYIYVESLKDSPSMGLYHVEALPGGRKVAAVDRFNSQMIHDVISVTPAEYAAASRVFEHVAEFLAAPEQALARASVPSQPLGSTRKSKPI